MDCHVRFFWIVSDCNTVEDPCSLETKRGLLGRNLTITPDKEILQKHKCKKHKRVSCSIGRYDFKMHTQGPLKVRAMLRDGDSRRRTPIL
ncbi:hypothetical protein TNCV_2099351 [Trichonephila clavipes]|nr:hypothetical protein TNCV_2099351 [Trichonephila clavipes]